MDNSWFPGFLIVVYCGSPNSAERCDKSLSIASRGQTAGRPSQKLPSTAIYCHLVAAKPLRQSQP